LEDDDMNSSAAAGLPAGAQRMKNVMDGIFQANPAYELVLFDRLPPEQRESLAPLSGDPDFYGILRPRHDSRLGIKSVCRDTALLLYTLQSPGPLPAYVLAQPGAPKAIAQLILDGVLSIQSEGALLSGPSAFSSVCEPLDETTPGNCLAVLSRDALRYAQRLTLSDAARLSMRLYSYNRIPLSPGWRKQFPDAAAVARCLGVEPDGPNFRLLSRDWIQMETPPPNDAWLAWQSRQPRVARRSPGYKLYLSPHPGFVRDAFDALVRLAADSGAYAFKAGKEIHGLLRPDKIVVYFHHRDALRETARELGARLERCPAQGVPFTAQLGAGPLLSWGIDPPEETAAPAWLRRESWRLWVSNRLAVALLAARREESSVEPWRFALERLRLEGVDTNLWTPLDPPAKGEL
jgi:hypothetical protein